MATAGIDVLGGAALLLTPFAPIGAGMMGSGFGSLAGGAISEKLGGSYELGAGIGNIVGGVVGSILYKGISNVKAANIASSKEANYLEYKALRQQGYNATNAHDLITQFREGVNPGNKFGFHFTSIEGGRGITNSGIINATKIGFRGPGVYAGKTPTPSWALKHIPYVGWGLGNSPVRIPVLLQPDMIVKTPLIPIETLIIQSAVIFGG